ncbi:hypothetical protein GCM10022215_08790 [Nocardioides fonticola]|uniref:VWFA domain-containing protein n=1 Tax=Nocardioides fonticola TaxID=450363 RepID=A0ABP7XDC4_9ACTN
MPRRSPAVLTRLAGAAAVLATLAAPVAAPVAAQAADDATPGAAISHVQTVDGGLDVLVSVPAGSDVDLASVAMTIDGVEADATAQQASGSDAVRRTTVLAIDTSNSMRGARFDAAKQAAETFLDSVPDDVYVGIVSFAGDVTTAQTPTLDHEAARSVLDSLTLSRETRLYDGVLSAITVAGTEGQRNLLVLSDGADTTDTRLSSVLDAVRRSDTLVDVISLDTAGAATNPDLEELAKAGDGAVIPATSDALRAAFADEADALQRQILVTAPLPAGLTSTEATVAVTLPTATGTLEADAFATVAKAAATSAPLAVPTIDAGGRSLPSWALYAGVLALGAGLVGVLMLLVPRPPPPMSAADRVTAYTASTAGIGAERPHLRIDTDQALTQAKDAAATMLRRNRDLESRIARRLDAAGSELKPAEWLLLHVGIFLGVGLIGVLLAAGNIVLGVFVILLGAIMPWVVLVVRGSRRRRKFDSVLPDTLQLMSGALAAGLSLQQAVDTIVKEGSDPIASEFRRVLVETRLGVPVEIALDGVAERFGSKDFEWVVMAIRIQRQVGGNLAELLDTVAATMREREYMRRQVASLSAEGRLSAWVLGLLPPLFLLYLVVTQRSYVEPLFTDPRGWFMLAFAGLWLGIGVFWMSRLVKVEV